MLPPVIAAYAAQLWVKVVAVLALMAALLFAGYHFGVRLTEADWAQERLAWQKERAALATQYAAAEKLARIEEKRRADEAQRVADQLAVAQTATAARAARAERTVDSLRNTIAALNARPVPDAPGCPAVASYADEARVARELLGACAARYQGVAAEADQLRDQVTGLQGWVDAIEKTP